MSEQSLQATTRETKAKYVGQSVERVEDEAILNGESQFLADINLPNMLYAKVKRSPYAHAKILDIDTKDARRMDGVVDVITHEEVQEIARKFGQRRSGFSSPEHPALAGSKVRMEGDGIAAVAATSEYKAGDAIEVINAEFERLPPITTIDQARHPQSGDEIIHPELDDNEDDVDGNTWGEYTIDVGDIDSAFDNADHVVSHEILTSRPTAVPLETHGVVADYSPSTNELTMYTTTQEAHQLRRDLAATLDLPYNKITIKQPPNMGGGFGHKLGLKAHEVIAAVLSIRNGQPVKLVLTRLEEFQATRCRQPQKHELELALTDEGEFLGIRGDITAQGGAYAAETKPGLVIAAMFLPTPYSFENIEIRGRCVFTNTVPAGPYRGFGLTQATTARESLIDKAARELGIDRWQIREQNIVTNDQCPAQLPIGYYLDSCGVDECFDLVRENLDLKLLEAKGPAHKVRGLGIAAAMHVSSLQRPTYDADNSAVTIQLYEDGSISVKSDQCPMGTGIETTLSQIIADELGIHYQDVTFEFGDSENTPFGLGSWGSRGITIGGNAAYMAARTLRELLFEIASHQTDVPPSRFEVEEGTVVDEVTGTKITIRDLAYDAHYNGDNIPPEMNPGPVIITESFDSPAPGPLDESGRSDTSTTYPTNVHGAIVEIDITTGEIDIIDYAISDDAGTIINPMIVEGQVQGGTVQGLGMALGENLHYERNGMLMNGSMEEYALPLIRETPMLTKIAHADAVSERSPIGAKGVGESGAITAPVTILNAVNDALVDEFSSEDIIDLPLTPETVHSNCKAGIE